MGAKLKSETVRPQIEALETRIAALESERVAALERGLPTVQAQIDHLKLQVQIHSHLESIARYRENVGSMKAHSMMQRDLTAEIHKLQRDVIHDRLDALHELALRQAAAASKLAGFAS